MYRVVVDRLSRLMAVVLVASGSLQGVVVRLIVNRLSDFLRSHLRQLTGFKDFVGCSKWPVTDRGLPTVVLESWIYIQTCTTHES